MTATGATPHTATTDCSHLRQGIRQSVKWLIGSNNPIGAIEGQPLCVIDAQNEPKNLRLP